MNTTSPLQPLDQGVIKNMKTHFKRRLLQHVLASVEDCDIAREITKKINVLDAVKWIKFAWDEVKDVTIQLTVDNLTVATEQWDEVDEISLQEVIKRAHDAKIGDKVNVSDFVTSDDLNDEIHEGSGDDREKHLIPSNVDECAEEAQIEDDDDEPAPQKVTVGESRRALETV